MVKPISNLVLAGHVSGTKLYGTSLRSIWPHYRRIPSPAGRWPKRAPVRDAVGSRATRRSASWAASLPGSPALSPRTSSFLIRGGGILPRPWYGEMFIELPYCANYDNEAACDKRERLLVCSIRQPVPNTSKPVHRNHAKRC